MNVLFVDHPTGNGFSFNGNNQTGNNDKDEKQVVEDLLELIKQFYQVFPDMMVHRLYLLGSRLEQSML